MSKSEYIKIKAERYENWFNSFLNSTDEKPRMGYIFKHMANALYAENQFECRILDIGCGEGTLAKQIAESLKGYCKNLYYHGMEYLDGYTERASVALQGLNISSVDIKQGSFLNPKDLAMLPNDADIILASHVAYYATNITNFVYDLVDKSKDSTTLVFFHQSTLSSVSKFRKKYDLDSIASPQEEIRKSLELCGFEVLELLYPSIIEFPNDIPIRKIVQDDGSLSGIENHLPGAKKLKNLLEFIVHAPLEYLEDRGELTDYTNQIEKVLETQGGYLIFWDVMQIGTKSETKNVKALIHSIKNDVIPSEVLGTSNDLIKEPVTGYLKQVEYRMEKLEIGALRPLELACYEGNIDIVEKLDIKIETYDNRNKAFIGLNLASRNGHINLVGRLLEIKEKFDLNAKVNGVTALHLATAFHHPYIVKLLLDAGINAGMKDEMEQTALYLAFKYCNPQIAEILWDYSEGSNEKLELTDLIQLKMVLKAHCSERTQAKAMHHIHAKLNEKYVHILGICTAELDKVLSGNNDIIPFGKSKSEIIQQLMQILESNGQTFKSKGCEALDITVQLEHYINKLYKYNTLYKHIYSDYYYNAIKVKNVLLLSIKNIPTNDGHFIDRENELQSLDYIVSTLDSNKGVVLGGVIGIGKTTLSAEVVKKWVTQGENRSVLWFNVTNCKKKFNKQIIDLADALDIKIKVTNEEVHFGQNEIYNMMKELKDIGQVVLFVFDNYLESNTDNESDHAISQEPKKTSIISNNQSFTDNIQLVTSLLYYVESFSNAVVLISTRNDMISYEQDLELVRINLEPFSRGDTVKYFDTYGITLHNDSLGMLGTISKVPISLFYIAQYLSDYPNKLLRNLAEEQQKSPCIAIPLREITLAISILPEEEKKFLIYASYLGSNYIEFELMEAIIKNNSKVLFLTDTFSLIKINEEENSFVLNKDINKMLRDYFKCYDAASSDKVVKAIGNSLLTTLDTNKKGEKYIHNKYKEVSELASKFCLYANLGEDYKFINENGKNWSCESDPHIAYLLGREYFSGIDIEQNRTKGCEWFKKAGAEFFNSYGCNQYSDGRSEFFNDKFSSAGAEPPFDTQSPLPLNNGINPNIPHEEL